MLFCSAEDNFVLEAARPPGRCLMPELDEAFVEDNEAAGGIAEAGAAAAVAVDDVAAVTGDFSLLLVVIFVVGGCSSLEELQ